MNRSTRILLPLLLIALGAVSYLIAGGPLGASGTTPRKYASGSMPIPFRVDRGGLGAFSNTTASSIATYAFNQWDNVTSAALSFSNAGQLARDVTTATDAYISGTGQYSDGVNPVVFDSSGAITDSKLGNGARNSVLGFAGSAWTGTTYVEGYVIINGTLSGSGGTEDEDEYKGTITHEIGHFLGLSHAQVAMHADYATMYPQLIKGDQKTLDPDDTAAIANLYPATGYAATVGSISGTVRRADATNLSGVNVIAMDSATGASYSTVVDYFSGNASSFVNRPSATGSYTIAGLPPGRYFVRIEPILAEFSGGSSVGSYDTPVNTAIAREWYNGAGESGEMLLDNTNQKTGVMVAANTATTGINFIANESSAITSLSHHNGAPSITWTLPGGGGGVISRYATRYTAPSNGSLVGIKLRLDSRSIMPLNGTLTVGVHANTTGSLAGVPGTLLGSVTIPFSDLEGDMVNEIWLRGLGTAVNFNNGDEFHVVLTTNGVGTIQLLSDNGNPTQNRSSYYTSATGWRNFPHGFAAGTPGYNIIMSAIYTSSVAGNPTPEVSLSPTSLNFGRVRPGNNVDRTITLTNVGTGALNVNGTSLIGSDSLDFSITNGGTFTLAPNASRVLTVRFAPRQAGGSKSAMLSINSNAATSPDNVPLIGMGVSPTASKLVTTIAFGSRRTGGVYVIDTAIIQNTGNDTLKISGASLIGADAGNGITLMSGTGPHLLLPDSIYRARVQFSPTQRRAYSATLNVTHDDSIGLASFPITGTGIAPVVTSSRDSIVFGNVRVGTTATSTALQLSNTGDAPLTITGINFVGGDSAAFSIAEPTAFPIVIAPGQSTQIRLRFIPDQRRAYQVGVRVSHDATPSTTLYQVTGRGIAPVVVAPTLMDFGQVRVSDSVSRTVRLHNTGDAPVEIRKLETTGANAAEYVVVGPAVPVSIEPGDSVSVEVRFRPAAVGARIAVLTVTYDDPSMLTEVVLSGVGSQGRLSVAPVAIDFGDVLVGTPATRQTRLSNIGTFDLRITSLAVAGSRFSLVAPPGDPIVIVPGGSIDLDVRFLPTASGDTSGTLVITPDVGDPITVTLEGRGVEPGLTLSRSALAFGNVPTGRAMLDSFTITNTGSAPLTGATVRLIAGSIGAFEIVSPTGPFTLLPGESKTVVIRLKSQAAAGDLAATLEVQSSGAPSRQVELTAAIVVGAISTVSEIDFGVCGSGMCERTVDVTNTGSAPVRIDSIVIAAMKDGVPGSYFITLITAPTTVAPGSSLLMTVRFLPMDGAGSYTGSLTLFTDNVADSAVTIALRGSSATSAVREASVQTGSLSLTLASVTPNPARSSAEILLRVRGAGRAPVALTLVDIAGRTVRSIFDGPVTGTDHAERFPVDLDGLPSGEYQVVLRSADGMATTKLILVE